MTNRAKFLIVNALLILVLLSFYSVNNFSTVHTTEQLYDWENVAIYRSSKNLKLNEKDTKEIIKTISNDYGIETPHLYFWIFHIEVYKGAITIGEFNPRLNEIFIYYKGDNLVTVLHECAHAVHCNRATGIERFLKSITSKNYSHGTEFVDIYLELLVKYGKFDKNYLIQSMKIHNIINKHSQCNRK